MPTDDEIGFPTGNRDERELLLDWLRYLRAAVVRNTEGLSDDAARWRPDGSLISLLGIVNHLTHVEERWIDRRMPGYAAARSENEFSPGPELGVQAALVTYRERTAATDRTVREMASLSEPCLGEEGTDLRWVLLHLINETARQAGHADAHGETPTDLRLVWRTKPKAMADLEDEMFGKRILFTDREDWSITQVVAGYRSQWNVEADFRQMKDPKVVSFSPMFHWTDQKIRVHVMHCVLALMTARLMVREAAHADMAMSVRELLSTLAGIEETVLLYQGERGRPRARRMLTEMTPVQERLYDLFGLDAYAPTR